MALVDHFIAGKPYVVDGAPRFTATDPVNGKPVSEVALGTAAEIDLAVASSKAAWRSWFELPPVERGHILYAIARGLRDRSDEFVEIEVAETGKLVANAADEVEMTADYFEYYAGLTRAFFSEVIDIGSDQHVFTRHEPFGVIGIITPWNSPVLQAGRAIAPALAVGNAVVVKPSEFTPSSTVLLAQVATEAGLPEGLMNVVLGTGIDVGAALSAHKDVGKLAFTGSVVGGRAVAEAAAKRLVPVTLELGGKSPYVVFADANLEAAAKGIAVTLRNVGQVCSSPNRLLIERSVMDEFIGMISPIVKSYTPGSKLAPLTTPAQFEKVRSYFDVAKQDGATVVTGGTVATDPSLSEGRYVEPTLYADVAPTMRIFNEEIFGPVLTVTPFDTEDEAVELANATDYGLAATLWTSNGGRAMRVSARIDAGQVLVNGGRHNNETPFGGFKKSGIGREKGAQAMREYTQSKTVVMDIMN